MKTLGQLLMEAANGPDKVRVLSKEEVDGAMRPIVERASKAIEKLRREQRRLLATRRRIILD